MSFAKYGLFVTSLLAAVGLSAALISEFATSDPSIAHEGHASHHAGCAHDGAAIDFVVNQAIVSDLSKRLPPDQLAKVAERYNEAMKLPASVACFAPGTDFENLPRELASLPFDGGGLRYNILNRWTNIASGSTGSQGDPITLTYSFVPDGTLIPANVGFPSGNSNLNAWLNGIYGNPATWQALFAQVFDRWESLGGITYVFEPNDDGASVHVTLGQLGVRGDIRIGAKTLDGNSDVLAYNPFPNDGDMVFDSADGFYNSTFSNSLRLRNVISHEHGHGQGILHVCPFTGTKLMEPAIDLGFDGPQHDEIRAMHRNYGDVNEPDNTTGQATDLGLIQIGNSVFVGTVPGPNVGLPSSLVSIDANGEQDFFRITTDEPAAITVTLTPVGGVYDSSDQAGNGGCFSGNIIDSREFADLAVQVLNASNSQVVAEASANGLGAAEIINGAVLGGAGDYLIRVYETGSVAETQLYTLNIFVNTTATTPADFEVIGGETEFFLQETPTPLQVAVTPNDATIVPSSPTLIINDGSVSFIPMTEVQPNLWEVDLPALSCDTSASYFFQFSQTVAGQTFSTNVPPTAPGVQFSATPVDALPVLRNSGETSTGWNVSGVTAQNAGGWENGVPANGDRGDPATDADLNNQAWLTGNATGNTDVDGGSTVLTSPVFDLSNGGEIRYAYWLNDIPGTPLNGDSLTVEVANNAATNNWTQLRNYTTADSVWRFDTIDVGTEIAGSSTMRVRFTATDGGTQTVVEAGIDAVKAVDTTCITVVPPPPAPASVTASDGSNCNFVSLSWSAVAEADDYDVFRNTVDDEGSATLLMSGIVGTSFDDNTAVAGQSYFYFVRACNAGGGCGNFSPSDAGLRASVADPITSLTATTDMCGSIMLDWNDVPGAFLYNVFRGTVDDFSQATFFSPAFTSEVTDNLAPTNQTLYYWVVTNNVCGDSAESDVAIGVSLAAPANAPGNVMAMADMGGTVTVSWDAVPFADSYDVFRNTIDDAGSATFVGNTTMLSLDDATAPAGSLFYYVGATNACGDGPLSAGVSVDTGMAPAVPINVTASDDSCSNITVNWDGVVDAADYTIWRNTIDDFGSAASLGTTSATSFDDGTADAGVTYFYFVTASNASGTSGPSASASGVALEAPTSAPANAMAVDNMDGTVTVSWDAVATADSYDVFRNTIDDAGTATFVGNTTMLSLDDVAAPAGSLFYYVGAINTCGSGPLSPGASVDTGMAPPAPVNVLASSGTCAAIAISWDASAGADDYEVFRNTVDDFGSAASLGTTGTTSFDDGTADAGVTYFYFVTASNASGTSGPSASASGVALAAPTSAPANVMATVDMGGTVTVSWDAVANADSYDVFRNTIDDAGSAAFVGNTTMLSLDDPGAPSGQTLFYYVGAINACGNGPLSPGASVDTGMAPPAPVNVLASTGTCAAITISWDASAGADDYEVFRNTVDDFGSAASLGTTANTTFEDATAAAATSYFYFVTASNASGTSGPSASAAGDLGVLGDLNGDGLINGGDLQGLVDALVTTGNDCADLAAPMGQIDLADADAFVQLLLN